MPRIFAATLLLIVMPLITPAIATSRTAKLTLTEPGGAGHVTYEDDNVSGGTRDIFFGLETYVREKGWPKPQRNEFEVGQDQWAILRLHNGGVNHDPQLRTRVVVIALNKRVVLGPFRIRQWRDTIEVPVLLKKGANVIGVWLASKPGRRIAVEIVGKGGLTQPSDEVIEAAQSIHEEIPGARLSFSQVDGRLMQVQSSGINESDDTTLPVPLAEARGVDLTARVSAMLDYLERFQYAYGLKDPASVMAVAVEPFREDPNSNKPGDPSSLLTQSLVQTHEGLRIRGRRATGHFDGLGNLHNMITRLYPVGLTLGDKPSFGPEAALGIIEQQREALIAHQPDLFWLARGKVAEFENTTELLWVPTSQAPDAPLRLAYEIHLRNNLNMAMLLVDATTGEVVEASSATPSDWFDDGLAGTVLAPDEIGVNRFILSTLDDDTLHMGFGNNWADSAGRRWFAPGKLLGISDTAGRADLTLTYFDELEIPFSIGNTWLTDPSYVGSRRAATSLMFNLTRVLSYWAGFGWNSWDGRGSTLWMSINNNKSATGAPQLNAWGSGGVIQIGDGLTSTGQTSAGSAEVMGHEFMHNVISNTSLLEYRNESGAVNEALADFFGVAITAVGDRYASNLIGDDAGWNVRDMVNPSNLSQPEIYSAYRVMSADAGGVHTNSGIANKAHSLVVQGGSYRGFNVNAQGVAAAASVLRDSNKNGAYGPDVSMEEFAGSVGGYCNLIDTLLRIFGGARVTPLCQSFATAYRATQLYPGSNDEDVVLDGATLVGPYIATPGWKRLNVEVTNAGSGRQLLFNYDVLVADELGDGLLAVHNNWIGAGCTSGGSRTGVADPGETRCRITGIPGTLVAGSLTGIRNLTVSFNPPSPFVDGNLANNWVPLRVGSDYLPYRASIFDSDAEQQTDFVITSRNRLGGFPAGLVGTFLTRSSSHGPLSELAGNASEVLDADTDPDRSSQDFPTATLPYLAEDTPVDVEIVELPGATAVPGQFETYQVWFDADGGLDALDGITQYYVLLDASDIADELDETNNFLCVNCRAPGQGSFRSGVIVRFPLGTPIEEIFPDEYVAAAAKLPTLNPRVYQFLTVQQPRLNPQIVPEFPEPF